VRKRETGPQDVWETLAKKDALWTACTMGKRHADWSLEDFLTTGDKEVSWAMSVAQESGILPSRKSTAVDFGCGPGRLIGALKERFQRVIGIDTSPTMLSLARRAHPEANVCFSESLKQIEKGSIDLIYSAFVLQHLAQAELDECFCEFARILHFEGLLIFQYPARPRWTLLGISFRLLPPALLKAIQHYIVHYPGSMPMSWMATEDVSRRAAACGIIIAEHRTGPRYSPNWKDVWYFARQGSSRLADVGQESS
jgi:ubiquinone/menaquinone biosynthesis C-methylase UbiE